MTTPRPEPAVAVSPVRRSVMLCRGRTEASAVYSLFDLDPSGAGDVRQVDGVVVNPESYHDKVADQLVYQPLRTVPGR